jgi:hypothetical protein
MSRKELLKSRAELKQKYGEIVSDLKDKELENIFNDILVYGDKRALTAFDLMVRAQVYIEYNNTEDAVEYILDNLRRSEDPGEWNDENEGEAYDEDDIKHYNKSNIYVDEIGENIHDLYKKLEDEDGSDDEDDSDENVLDKNIINDFIEKLNDNRYPSFRTPYNIEEANKDVRNTNMLFERLEKKKKKTLPEELVEEIKDYHDPNHITEIRIAMENKRKKKTKKTEEEPGGGGYKLGGKSKKKATKKKATKKKATKKKATKKRSRK